MRATIICEIFALPSVRGVLFLFSAALWRVFVHAQDLGGQCCDREAASGEEMPDGLGDEFAGGNAFKPCHVEQLVQFFKGKRDLGMSQELFRGPLGYGFGAVFPSGNGGVRESA